MRTGPSRASGSGTPTDTPRLASLPEIEIWIARVRLGSVAFVVVEVGLVSTGYPQGYETLAWIVTAAFAAGAVLLYLAGKRANVVATGIVALLFDTCVIGAYAVERSRRYGAIVSGSDR
jgi:hypothetical protein